jgi:hypothetical protein
MAGHWNATNDPIVVTGRQLHVPGFTGTSSQRVAYTTSNLQVSDQWFETDTGTTWQWNGLVWSLMGGGGVGNSSLVVAVSYALSSLQTLILNQGIVLLII